MANTVPQKKKRAEQTQSACGLGIELAKHMQLLVVLELDWLDVRYRKWECWTQEKESHFCHPNKGLDFKIRDEL